MPDMILSIFSRNEGARMLLRTVTEYCGESVNLL